MPSRRRLVLALLALLAAVPLYFAFWRYHLKRFQEVRPGVFYRVAQPTEFGLRYLVVRYGMQTVLSVQLDDFRLYRGLLDPGGPDGQAESQYVASLGANHLQWPMGEEACWPWVTPWQFEEFFSLLDNPANLPVAVHCMGGRHRTGTLAALFRLEYDRWPAERVLEEMHDFDFGPPITLQEHNLRTYWPRPRPESDEWQALTGFWSPRLQTALASYEELVRRLTAARGGESIEDALCSYVAGSRDFSLPLAQRLIGDPGDPLAPLAAQAGSALLERRDAGPNSWWAAAALVADFGDAGQQARLLALLADRSYQAASPERYEAVVAGVTNRYTRNRIAFLRPLLENESPHLRPAARRYRYCDTAVSRLCCILDLNLRAGAPAAETEAWNYGRQGARAWFSSHAAAARPGPLAPPTGRTMLAEKKRRTEER